ncbi:tyrosine-type recombinase/integrase [Kribbella speibonae]|uniref:Integrase n=1 Tax=Kribbella speibonae TaxID=1572660 RepID=A0A4R0ITQ4_9ACTN|nr:integrase [Kribbella speibonae]TCC35874.1 integrase [Kribbella speibonae]
MTGTRRLNEYMLAARRDGGMKLDSITNMHSYHLARCLRFVRRRRAELQAEHADIPVADWLAAYGEPTTCLTETTRDDLRAYSEHRQATVKHHSWNTEESAIAGFFVYAVAASWIDRDPRPLWGRNQRDTLRSRVAHHRNAKFLTELQLRAFLEHGLRSSQLLPGAPSYPDRDYCYGLTLVSTGMRRAEGAALLDVQIPPPHAFPPGGVIEFVITGKGARPRTVYVARELATQIELYRIGERARLVAAVQPTLRRRKRAGAVDLVETRDFDTGSQHIRTSPSGEWIPIEVLDGSARATMVTRAADGSLNPISLFLGRNARPLVEHWDHVFDLADARLRSGNQPDTPPAHLKVTPHVMRHTFAVRMLAALMREGRERSADPYQLLANPVITVQQLLGHASPETTQVYLYAAERFTEELPAALRGHIANALGHETSTEVPVA